MKSRPAKYYRLNYSSGSSGAMIGLFSDPDELRLVGSMKSFISIKESGITISPGLPNKLMLQSLPGGISYAGMIKDLPFPLGLLPMPFMPKQVFTPPLAGILSTVRSVSLLSSMFVGL